MRRRGNGSGHGGPAAGAGWGGPARGASTSRIKPGDPEGIQRMSNDAAVKARRAQRAAEMEDVLYDIARAGEAEMARINAAARLHAIYEGLPVARQHLSGADGGPLTVVEIVQFGKGPAT